MCSIQAVGWKLSLAGLLVGLLVGMTGMGGGSLMTPMLVLLFGFNTTVAIALTSFMAPSSSRSGRFGTVSWGRSICR
jgi:uncharacterized protein